MTRVVGGTAGGRRLRTPTGRGTRPTAERVREGLFSTLLAMLGDLGDIPFLDLYAGSGAVGLEAASRGARPVVLVENNPSALRVLRANVATLALDGVRVEASSVLSFLAEPAEPYTACYVDPPYADPVEPVLAALAAGGHLTGGGVVAVERATRGRGPEWPAGFRADRDRRYGDTTLWYALWYGRRP